MAALQVGTGVSTATVGGRTLVDVCSRNAGCIIVTGILPLLSLSLFSLSLLPLSLSLSLSLSSFSLSSLTCTSCCILSQGISQSALTVIATRKVDADLTTWCNSSQAFINVYTEKRTVSMKPCNILHNYALCHIPSKSMIVTVLHVHKTNYGVYTTTLAFHHSLPSTASHHITCELPGAAHFCHDLTSTRAIVGQHFIAISACALMRALQVGAVLIAASVVRCTLVNIWEKEKEQWVG